MTNDRRVLVDNSTLSGVERITGMSKTLNLNYIDNDILCLEKLITAILFSDTLIGIDDYKEEYRSKRLRNFDFISFIDIDEPFYEKIREDAASFAKSMTFSFENTKPAGDVVSFFDALKIDPQLRWNVWTSSEYLTLSYLVDDPKRNNYETAIDSVFRNELIDGTNVSSTSDYDASFQVAERPDINHVKDLVKAFETNNPNYRGVDGKSALQRIVFGFGWAAERSYFYNSIANQENADAYLAPLRDSFCESCCRLDHKSQVDELLQSLKENSQQTLISILEPSGQAKFAIRLPFFTAYLISKTDNPLQCIEHALELRTSSEFASCRTILQNLSHLDPNDRLKEVNGILRYLEQSCDKLMSKYSISTGNGTQFSLSFGLSGVGFGADIKLGELFKTHKNKPFARVFRNIAQDMLNVERLGGLYDKLCSSIHEHKDANHPRICATPKYMEDKESEYGRPANL